MTSQIWDDSHKAMAMYQNQVNAAYSDKYTELMSLKSSKGKAVNKREPLRELVNLWKMTMAKADEHGVSMSSMLDTGFLARSAWTQDEQYYDDQELPIVSV